MEPVRSASWSERGRAALLAVALVFGVAACPGSLEDPGRFVDGGDVAADDDAGGGGEGACPEGTDVEADLMAARCGGSVCHGAEAPAAGLDLVSPGIAERMIDVPSTQESCGGAILLVPGDPDASLLFEKLLPSPSCGAQMPLAQAAFDDGEIACVREWIAGMSAP